MNLLRVIVAQHKMIYFFILILYKFLEARN